MTWKNGEKKQESLAQMGILYEPSFSMKRSLNEKGKLHTSSHLLQKVNQWIK